MREQRRDKTILLYTLAVSFLVWAITTAALTAYFGRAQFETLGRLCQQMIDRDPGCKIVLLEALNGRSVPLEENILSAFGYRPSDFLTPTVLPIAAMGLLIGIALFLLAFRYREAKVRERIEDLTQYLERVNTGGPGLLLDTEEDEFSKLRDELYKTITALYQTRDAALAAKQKFAQNLANIAHQLKTPITAISLSLQMMRRQISSDCLPQIEGQLSRLTHLEASLLLLSRLDAGALVLQTQPVDVFTMLTLACDQLQELLDHNGVSVAIPEGAAVSVTADLDWTMEAVMNLLKNCMEHSPRGGVIHCAYEENPLYVSIRIWDEGPGFAKEDMPHLFTRFYRGQNAGSGGIGIGLSLAKELIELQNGVIQGYNLPQGGACFDIRFYRH